MTSQKTKNKQAARAACLKWTNHAWDEYLWWQQHDPAKVVEINQLIGECLRDPFKGTGKPEPLRHDLSGFWSRRIDKVNRLVYLYEDGVLSIVQCRFHY
jgi:toxin YoeB